MMAHKLPRTAAEAREFVRREKERRGRKDAAKAAAHAALRRKLEQMRREVNQPPLVSCRDTSGRSRATRTDLDPKRIYAARAGRIPEEKQGVENAASAPRRRPRSFAKMAREVYRARSGGSGSGSALIPTGARGAS
jgi:hypothetical protein